MASLPVWDSVYPVFQSQVCLTDGQKEQDRPLRQIQTGRFFCHEHCPLAYTCFPVVAWSCMGHTCACIESLLLRIVLLWSTQESKQLNAQILLHICDLRWSLLLKALLLLEIKKKIKKKSRIAMKPLPKGHQISITSFSVGNLFIQSVSKRKEGWDLQSSEVFWF